jgi:hypothetical protein
MIMQIHVAKWVLAAQIAIILGWVSITLYACFPGEPVNVVVSESLRNISDESTVIEFPTPMSRTKRSLSVYLRLKEFFLAEPPWTGVRLSNGRLATIHAVLITDQGVEYKPQLIGSLGGGELGYNVDLRFNDTVPKEAQIVQLKLASTQPLTVLRVVWSDSNPL